MPKVEMIIMWFVCFLLFYSKVIEFESFQIEYILCQSMIHEKYRHQTLLKVSIKFGVYIFQESYFGRDENDI